MKFLTFDGILLVMTKQGSVTSSEV